MAALTISLDVAPTPLPASLASRLSGGASPTKTPQELADELAKHAERTSLLRKAHLDAIKDRAARDVERVAEAATRKRRLAAIQVEKIQRRMDAADNKVAARREATAAKREAWKERRAEMARNVAEARRRAVADRAASHAEALEQEKLAFFKHAKTIQAVHDKSAWQVKHAAAVVAAQKEKSAAHAKSAAERLSTRLEAAELRRKAAATSPLRVSVEAEATSTSPPTSPHKVATSPRKKKVLSRVRNEQQVEAAMRDLMYKAAMEKAVAKREAILQQKSAKAAGHNAVKADRLAAAHAKAAGTDKETAATKSALYDKLLRAEVGRLTALKQRVSTATKARGETTSVIVVTIDHKAPRMPPAALVRRLSVVPHKLVATATARQAAAASRRSALRAELSLKMAKSAVRRAAALGRVQSKMAARAAAVKGRMTRSLVTKAMNEGRVVFALAQESRRSALATKSRKEADEARAKTAEAKSARCAGATERRAAVVRRTAKQGVSTLRAGRFKSRREALDAAVAKRAEAHAARCTAATATKAAKLALRVAHAKRAAERRAPRAEKKNSEEWVEVEEEPSSEA